MLRYVLRAKHAIAARLRSRRGKSGLHRAGCQVTPGGETHDQCNREQTADGPRKRDQVRVKGCGKSAPRGW